MNSVVQMVSMALTMDVRSLNVLFPHLRPLDVLMAIFQFFLFISYAHIHLHVHRAIP